LLLFWEEFGVVEELYFVSWLFWIDSVLLRL
jgi:hypothetical protein